MPTTAESEIMLAAEPPAEFLSSEEFLDWLTPGKRADLISGQIITHSPVSIRHAFLLDFVHPLLSLYVQEKKLGHVFREVVAVKLSSRHTVLPDLAYFTNEQMKEVAPNHAPIAPTVSVEALSPESEIRDRRHKFAAYEEFGVKEYWILDPERHVHQFYKRSGDLLVPYGDLAEDRMDSEAIPGFYLRRMWLNAPESANVLACLREILAG
jgi:Uma2 family endonuclease